MAIGTSADAATHGTAPWLIAIVPLALALALALGTVLGAYLGLRQRHLRPSAD